MLLCLEVETSPSFKFVDVITSQFGRGTLFYLSKS